MIVGGKDMSTRGKELKESDCEKCGEIEPYNHEEFWTCKCERDIEKQKEDLRKFIYETTTEEEMQPTG